MPSAMLNMPIIRLISIDFANASNAFLPLLWRHSPFRGIAHPGSANLSAKPIIRLRIPYLGGGAPEAPLPAGENS